MNGLVYTINKLGESLATTEHELAKALQEVEVLRARVAELEASMGDTTLREQE